MFNKVFFWVMAKNPLNFSPEELAEASKAFSDVLEHDLPQLQKQIKKTESAAEKQSCDRCGRDLY
jgi:ornithine--oxo-acid transaminase